MGIEQPRFLAGQSLMLDLDGKSDVDRPAHIVAQCLVPDLKGALEDFACWRLGGSRRLSPLGRTMRHFAYWMSSGSWRSRCSKDSSFSESLSRCE